MKKTVNTVWFFNLAIADIIFIFFLFFARAALVFQSSMSLALCKINGTLIFLTLYASVYLLMIISIDRCISVRHPVWAQNHRTPRLASFVALAVWILALVLCSPVMYFRQTEVNPTDKDPLNCCNSYGEFEVIKDAVMVINRCLSNKPYKVITAVIVPFFVFWLPYYVFLFIDMNYGTQPNMQMALYTGFPLVSCLAFINSCLNPIFYVFMGQNFRETLRRSLFSAFENAFTEEEMNYTMDGTEFLDFYLYSENLENTMRIVSLVIYGFIFVLGFLGNGLVIFITGFHMKKTVNTVWVLNLAIADFIFIFFLIFVHATVVFKWYTNQFLCKMNQTLMFLNLYASVYTLMVISIDCCIFIRHSAFFVALGVWILALVLSSPYLYFGGTTKDPFVNNTICFNDYGNNIHTKMSRRHNIISSFIFAFVIPFTVIFLCYGAIVLKLRSSQLFQASKPYKIITALIVTFFVCWFPYHVFSFIDLKYSSRPDMSLVVNIGDIIASCLAFINSCINPILYVFMVRGFKDSLKLSLFSALENVFMEEVRQTSTTNKTRSSAESNRE
ncbi:G-protein coupled receptor 1, partial [Ophiophagus hannah]